MFVEGKRYKSFWKSSEYFTKSADSLQTDYTIDAKPPLGLFPDRKLPRYGSLPRRPRQLEGREVSHDVLEDLDYPRASPNVSNPISPKVLIPKLTILVLRKIIRNTKEYIYVKSMRKQILSVKLK